jgi:predicted small secreted protein
MEMIKVALSLLAAAVVGLAGCNTMEGAGKDIQRAGETIESAAKKK